MTVYHTPVLLSESVEGLLTDLNGVYVDVTFGGGGHSREVLARLGEEGRLVAFDQDEDARRNVIDDGRFLFVHSNFKYVQNFLKYYGVERVDGLLADLGVSSHEFDVPERGFSFRFDALLDMRMNRSSELTAELLVNEYDEVELVRVFSRYGELKNSRKVAFLIAKGRKEKRIRTTGDLIGVLKEATPVHLESKFLAKVFQALRIEVNGEMDVLKNLLEGANHVIKPGGRLVVISYHSLEDRLVKNFATKGNFEGKVEKDFYGNVQVSFRVVGKKVIGPDADEMERNSRARSAKLRIFEKI